MAVDPIERQRHQRRRDGTNALFGKRDKVRNAAHERERLTVQVDDGAAVDARDLGLCEAGVDGDVHAARLPHAEHRGDEVDSIGQLHLRGFAGGEVEPTRDSVGARDEVGSRDDFVAHAWDHVLAQWLIVSRRTSRRVGAFVVSSPDHRNGFAYVTVFGRKDSWSDRAQMTFWDYQEIVSLLESCGGNVYHSVIEEGFGRTINGEIKYWNVFKFIYTKDSARLAELNAA